MSEVPRRTTQAANMKPVDKNHKELEKELKQRDLVHQVTAPVVFEEMVSGSMSAYVGFDPTADSLHVGHLLPILTMRRLQRYGVRPIIVAGGGTGMVGDPSGRSTERNLLSPDELAYNLSAIESQLVKMLDFDGVDEKRSAIMLDNSTWLSKVSLLQFLRDVGKHFSISQMVAKDSVRTRLEQREEGISFTEFSYMLLQAYDYLWLYDNYSCKLQIGASDQWGNITMGIELIRKLRSQECWGLTIPLLTQTDGSKFGKTKDGALWLDRSKTSPFQLFQYFYNCDDSQVGKLLRYFSFRSTDELEDLIANVEVAPEKRVAQQALAYEIVELVHGSTEAQLAKRISELLFSPDISTLSESELLDAFGYAPSTTMAREALVGGRINVLELFAKSTLEHSISASRRTINQGGAYINNTKRTNPDEVISPKELLCDRYLLLRKGKKTLNLITFE